MTPLTSARNDATSVADLALMLGAVQATFTSICAAGPAEDDARQLLRMQDCMTALRQLLTLLALREGAAGAPGTRPCTTHEVDHDPCDCR